jgi:GT2 family glycosyltransferase
MTAVIIVNWNGRPLLPACLQSVQEQIPAPDLVIVVDNASSDGSVAYLRTAWPGVQVIEAGSNLGFPAGNNLGIRAALAAGVEYVLLLNSDAQLLPGALEKLRQALERTGPSAWAAAPKILYRRNPGVIWSAGGRFDWWRGVSVDRGIGEPDRGQYDRPERVEFANACCLLIRSQAFRDLGLLDEAYFMYFEDSDFIARLSRAGGQVRYEPSAVALHDVFGSSGGAAARPSLVALYYSTRNRWRFVAHNAPDPLRRVVAHGFTIASRIVRMLEALVRGRRAEAGVMGLALYDAYLRRASGRTYDPAASNTLQGKR